MPRLALRTLSAIALLASGIAHAAQWVGVLEDRPEARDLDKLLAEQALKPGENLKAIPLVKTEHESQVLVQVRDREPLHYHADSDITVFLLRGAGTIRLGDKRVRVKAGDVLHIPRGTIHAFINEGRGIAAALVVYSPVPGTEDRVLIRER